MEQTFDCCVLLGVVEGSKAAKVILLGLPTDNSVQHQVTEPATRRLTVSVVGALAPSLRSKFQHGPATSFLASGCLR
jgi:hypothetical protein